MILVLIISYAYRNIEMPVSYDKYLQEIERVSITLYAVMTTGSTANVEMLIHIMNTIDDLFCKIKQLKICDLKITEEENSRATLDKNAALKSLKKIDDFFRDDKDGIQYMIHKYKYIIWEDPDSEPMIIVYSYGEEKWREFADLFRENHVLYSLIDLSKDSSGINFVNFKRNCITADIPADDFWKDKVAKHDYSIEDVSCINLPIILKTNSINLYSEQNNKLVDYIQCGFDLAKLNEKIKSL